MGKYRIIVKVCYGLGWDDRFLRFYNGLKALGVICDSDDAIINLESEEQMGKVNELSKTNGIQVRLLLVQDDDQKQQVL